jgi:hypothetical protein
MTKRVNNLILIPLSTSVLFSCGLSVFKQKVEHREKAYEGEFYFPLTKPGEEYHTNGKLDTFQNNWYSKHLKSLEEPVLFTKTDSIKIYRFTHLGTWSAPFTYRIEKSGSLVSITYRLTDGQGGYDAGKLTANKYKIIPAQYWDSLDTKIRNIDFWTSQTHEMDRGTDGSEWILEGYSNGAYYCIVRWSPEYNGDPKFVEVCHYFEELFNHKNTTDTR